MPDGVWSMDSDGSFTLSEPYQRELEYIKYEATNAWYLRLVQTLCERTEYAPEDLKNELLRRNASRPNAAEVLDEFIIEALSGDLFPAGGRRTDRYLVSVEWLGKDYQTVASEQQRSFSNENSARAFYDLQDLGRMRTAALKAAKGKKGKKAVKKRILLKTLESFEVREDGSVVEYTRQLLDSEQF